MMTLAPAEQLGIPDEGSSRRKIIHLAPELIHMICHYLGPMDIAGIRTLNRTIAAVGLQHLVSQIHLIPKPDSFDKLLAVAEHPLARQYVTSIFYEAELLKARGKQAADWFHWEKGIVGPDYAAPLEEINDPYFDSACDRLPKRYVQFALAVARNHHHQHHYADQELHQAYETHRKIWMEQRCVNALAIYQERMVKAMKMLPNLRSIFISRERGSTKYYRSFYAAGLSDDVTSPPTDADRLCASQLSLLLSAADEADVQITHLICGSLGQLFMDHSLGRSCAMKRSIRYLQSLHLFFTHIPTKFELHPKKNPNGSDAAGTDSLRFATSAPNLKILSIRFENEKRPIDPPDLKHIVLDFQWSCLASATFSHMTTNAETLTGFCDRHFGTLRDFSLTDITLRGDQGTSVLHKMRQVLALNNMTFDGRIRDVEHCWNFERGGLVRMKDYLERYIVNSDSTQTPAALELLIAKYKEYNSKAQGESKEAGLGHATVAQSKGKLTYDGIHPLPINRYQELSALKMARGLGRAAAFE